MSERPSDLRAAVRIVRTLRRLSIKAAAEEIGIAELTLSRFEKTQGDNFNPSTRVAVLAWLSRPTSCTCPDHIRDHA